MPKCTYNRVENVASERMVGMDVNLVLFKKSGKSKAFSLPSSVTVVGRRQDCDLCIPLMIVSKRHCELNLDRGGLRLRDLDSRNGTFLNGNRVTDEAEISAGDKIQIGPLNFVAQIDGSPENISEDFLKEPEGLGQTSLPEKQFLDHAENPSEFEIPSDHNATEILDIIDDGLIDDDLLGDD
jgi:pSer/pThr/pTyr-binding forkhead associated (FHA) protein